MTYLFVVAHPDDEVLGAGGLIHKLSRSGERAAVFVLNTVDTTRYLNDPGRLKVDLMTSDRIIGADTVCGSYEDSEFHNASHRKMVQDIERMIATEQPDFIFTHHSADINSDHYWCSQAVQEAARYGQRGRYAADPVKGLYFMEVQSSTDWGVNAALRPFEPNTYVAITEEDIHAKLKALAVYENVLRPFPHPRSPEGVRALASIRGSQAGYPAAEAFQCVFRRGI